jgi:cytochrome d ubiquinol oxidase subunit I
MVAYAALQKLKQGDATDEAKAAFEAHKEFLGYGLLLKPFTANVTDATPDQIAQAAERTIPPVLPLFFSFRLMVGLGLLFLATFVLAFWFCAQRTLLLEKRRWFLRWAVWAIPLPWIAAEFGWIVAEMGRQPWSIAGILPTNLAASNLTTSDLYLSIAGFVLFYTVLFIIEIMLMFKYARLGPSSLHTGRYHHETNQPLNQPLPTNTAA